MTVRKWFESITSEATEIIEKQVGDIFELTLFFQGGIVCGCSTDFQYPSDVVEYQPNSGIGNSALFADNVIGLIQGKAGSINVSSANDSSNPVTATNETWMAKFQFKCVKEYNNFVEFKITAGEMRDPQGNLISGVITENSKEISAITQPMTYVYKLKLKVTS